MVLDPLSAVGLAAAIDTLVATAGSVLHWTFRHADGVAHPVRDAAELQRQLGLLSAVLLQLKNVMNAEIATVIGPELEACRKYLGELDKKFELAAGGGVKKVIKVAVWPFRKAEVKEILEALERQKSLFDVALTGDVARLLKTVDEKESDIRASQIRVEALQDQIHASQARVESFQTQMGDSQSRVEESQTRAEASYGRMESSQARIESWVDETRDGVSRLKVRALDQETERRSSEALSWLSEACGVDYVSNHSKASELSHPETGEWFLQRQDFLKWLDPKKAHYRLQWLSGIAGCGKTILMSKAINETKKQLSKPDSEDNEFGLAYYYFDFGSSAKQSPHKMLLALLDQLARQLSELPSSIEALKKRFPAPNMPDTNSLLTSLTGTCASFKTTYLFVDAIDECDDSLKVLEILDAIVTTAGNKNLRLLITSRAEFLLRHGLGDTGFREIPILKSQVDRDIAIYVRDELENNPKRKYLHLSPALRHKVTKKLSNKANGMFLWAKCQLDDISQQLTSKGVRKALKNLPKTVQDTYQRMIEKISPETLVRARLALHWIVAALEPMSFSALVEAVDFVSEAATDANEEDDTADKCSDEDDDNIGDSDDDHNDDDDDYDDFEYTDNYIKDPDIAMKVCGLETCGGLLHIDEEGYVELAHQSVKEFLHTPRAEKLHVDAIQVHLWAAKSCFRYMLSGRFNPAAAQPGAQSAQRPPAFAARRNLDFFKYSCDYGFKHIARDDSIQHAILPFMLEIQSAPETQRTLLETYNFYESHFPLLDRNHPRYKRGLYADRQIAIGFEPGLLEIYERENIRLSSDSGFVSRSIVTDLPILALALSRAEPSILIQQDSGFWSPLCFAVAKNNVDIVEQILPLLPLDWETLGVALIIAIASGSENVAVAMLDIIKNAVTSSNPQDEILSSFQSLYEISIILCGLSGSVSILLRLLSEYHSRYAADASDLDDAIQVALLCATHQGHTNCVEFLLAAGIQPRTTFANNKYRQILRARGNEFVRTAMAAWVGYTPASVPLQAEYSLSFDIDDQNEIYHDHEELPLYGSALHIAARNDDLGLVRVMVDKGMDLFEMAFVEGGTRNGQASPFLWAVQAPGSKVFDWILHELKDAFQWKHAVRHRLWKERDCLNEQPYVELLLKKGSEQGLVGQDVVNELLFHAIEEVSVKAVSTLLNYGADKNYVSKSGTPLICAMTRPLRFNPGWKRLSGRLAIIKQLLAVRADPNTTLVHDPKKTALLEAIRANIHTLAIVQELLKHGCSVCISPSRHRSESQFLAIDDPLAASPLIEACLYADFAVVETLLDAGAQDEVNLIVESYQDCSPLIAAAREGKMDIVRLLLDRGADWKIEPSTAKTGPKNALVAAIDQGYTDIAKLLCERNGNPDVSLNQPFWEALLVKSIFSRKQELGAMLLEWGVGADAVAHGPGDVQPVSALIAACLTGNKQLVQQLLEKSATETKPDPVPEIDCFVAATLSSNLELVELFIDRGYHPSTINPDKLFWCSLMAACSSADVNMAVLLLYRGADADACYPAPTEILVSKNATNLITGGVETLLWSDKGLLEVSLRETYDYQIRLGVSAISEQPGSYLSASLVGLNNFYATPLIAAAAKQSFDLVKHLVIKGADVNRVAKAGRYRTALIASLGPGRDEKAEIAKYLIQHGANLHQNVPGDYFGNAFIAACASNSDKKALEVWKLDRSLDCRAIVPQCGLGSPLIAASSAGSIDLVYTFLGKGCDPNQVVPGSIFGSPLIAAAWEQNVDVCFALIKAGADPSRQVHHGVFRYPLLAATSRFHHLRMERNPRRAAAICVNCLDMEAMCAPSSDDESSPSIMDEIMVDESASSIMDEIMDDGSSSSIVDNEFWSGASQVTTESFHEATADKAQIITTLLDAGADPNVTYKNMTPLIAAVETTRSMDDGTARLLLERNANPNTLVHRTASIQTNDVGGVKTNETAPGPPTYCALWAATELKGNVRQELIELLLSYGADATMLPLELKNLIPITKANTNG